MQLVEWEGYDNGWWKLDSENGERLATIWFVDTESSFKIRWSKKGGMGSNIKGEWIEYKEQEYDTREARHLVFEELKKVLLTEFFL